MKKITVISLIILLSGFIANAQVDTLKIQTSAQCEMCKQRIEKAMAFERGVESFDLDLDSKILTVVYKKDKNEPEKLRKAVSRTGYDADDVKANERAYSKLPACCKKPDDPDS